MPSLSRDLRKDLEKTVKQARRVAEAGARNAVEQIGVGEAEAPKHLTTKQRALRNRSRAHGRQLGDRRDPKGAQATTRLVQECAYEHWHRMLFARFLAEADLLIEPGSGMAITLDEVQELAREKATDWLPLASDYAERMLPQIFRKDDPVLDIALPPETRSEMEELLKGLTKPVFEANDSLGWVYQFWQSDKKDEVNKSEVKIGADELPAVTQLFTEDYMVLFLLHNTLGAWWAGKVLAGNPSLATSAPDEAVLRVACKVGDIDWTYLRFVRHPAEDGTEGPWRPVAGEFDGWPKRAEDLSVLDPCMGSGHFLVFALPILVAIRMTEERLSQSAAVDAVLKDNLFGLEIDPRCTQIAAFNLAFAAWRKSGNRTLPQLNLACSGLAIGVTKEEWLKLAEKAVTAADPAAKRDLLGIEKNLLTVGLEERLKNGLCALYDLFAQAPWLGSLIDPRRAGGDIFSEGFDKLQPLLASITAAADTEDAREMAVAAQGMAKAAEVLGQRFSLVATNVPYLVRGKQSDRIRAFCSAYAPGMDQDLATVFLKRCAELAIKGGSYSVVSPNNWLLQKSYASFRSRILNNESVNVVAKVGSGATAKASWDTLRALTIISCEKAGSNFRSSGLETSAVSDADRAHALECGLISIASHGEIKANPDHRLIISGRALGLLLGKYADSLQGPSTGDFQRFGRYFWEVAPLTDDWEFQQTSIAKTENYSGCKYVVRWEKGAGELADHPGSAIRGTQAIGMSGIAVTQMRSLPTSLFAGRWFDSNIAVLLPKNESHLGAIWAFCSSAEFSASVRRVDEKLGVTNASLTKVEFDLDQWSEVFKANFPQGLPRGSSRRPDEWLFEGLPVGSSDPLQTSTASLLGYRWPRQAGIKFPNCSAVSSDTLNVYADKDGIVCLAAVKGETHAEQRLNTLLADAFGTNWSAANLAGLLTEAEYAGRSLDDWLRDGYFAQHCELFQQRPFVWHIWDGRQDGFHALVNYHRLAAPNGEGRRTLEKLIYSYLGDWIDRQRADQKADVEGADARLAHSEHLKAELVKILNGEPPYDIFVRWKPLHEQPIGWDPDINDGVRMNIRPFMAARNLNARGANACILRATPKIKWDKDRGKEPTRDKADYPWFWSLNESSADFAGGEKFDGNRWNDLHYGRATKQAARDRHRAAIGGKA